jgi:hypothetical protein
MGKELTPVEIAARLLAGWDQCDIQMRVAKYLHEQGVTSEQWHHGAPRNKPINIKRRGQVYLLDGRAHNLVNDLRVLERCGYVARSWGAIPIERIPSIDIESF